MWRYTQQVISSTTASKCSLSSLRKEYLHIYSDLDDFKLTPRTTGQHWRIYQWKAQKHQSTMKWLKISIKLISIFNFQLTTIFANIHLNPNSVSIMKSFFSCFKQKQIFLSNCNTTLIFLTMTLNAANSCPPKRTNYANCLKPEHSDPPFAVVLQNFSKFFSENYPKIDFHSTNNNIDWTIIGTKSSYAGITPVTYNTGNNNWVWRQ